MRATNLWLKYKDVLYITLAFIQGWEQNRSERACLGLTLLTSWKKAEGVSPGSLLPEDQAEWSSICSPAPTFHLGNEGRVDVCRRWFQTSLVVEGRESLQFSQQKTCFSGINRG